MKERDMHEPFEKWLSPRSDAFTKELDTGACSPRFDYISIEGDKIVIYELKIKNAKDAIIQGNMSMLWADYAYVVMPEKYIHLAIKRYDYFCEWLGLLAINMESGNVHEFVRPKKDEEDSITSSILRQRMREAIILYNVADHCTPRRFPKRGY